MACFTLEYAARYWSCPMPFPKGKFVIAPLNIIDVLAVLPYYITLAAGSFSGISVLRVIRLVRIFRLFKVGRYAKSLRVRFPLHLSSTGTCCAEYLYLLFAALLLFLFAFFFLSCAVHSLHFSCLCGSPSLFSLSLSLSVCVCVPLFFSNCLDYGKSIKEFN